jgi:hypothetical protein
MLTKLINRRELKRRVELDGIAATEMHLSECLENGSLKPENFSVADLFVTLHEDGDELYRDISMRRSGGRRLTEAFNAVSTDAFSNITGQLVFNKIKEGYTLPEFLWPQLCTTIPTNFLDGEKIPGVGAIGDQAEIVEEAQPFPYAGLNEEWVLTQPTLKRGFIVPVTREIIVADRTGLLLKQAADTGKWLGVNKEKRVVGCVCGQVPYQTYQRNGVTTKTYLTSGAYVNASTSNTLVNWTSVETAELLFDAITDPNTGEPIIAPFNTLLVPSALKRTAHRILEANTQGYVDNTVSASTIRTYGENMLKTAGYNVMSSPYVKLATSSSAAWMFGNFKEAFAYMEVWAIETLQASDTIGDRFHRDIWQQYKVSERGVPAVLEPRYVTWNGASTP